MKPAPGLYIALLGTVASFACPAAAQAQTGQPDTQLVVRMPSRGVGGTSRPALTPVAAMAALKAATVPLDRQLDVCGKPELLMSMARNLEVERFTLVERFRAYPELHALSAQLASVKPACGATARRYTRAQYAAHERALKQRQGQILAAQAAFARYRVAVGH